MTEWSADIRLFDRTLLYYSKLLRHCCTVASHCIPLHRTALHCIELQTLSHAVAISVHVMASGCDYDALLYE